MLKVTFNCGHTENLNLSGEADSIELPSAECAMCETKRLEREGLAATAVDKNLFTGVYSISIAKIIEETEEELKIRGISIDEILSKTLYASLLMVGGTMTPSISEYSGAQLFPNHLHTVVYTGNAGQFLKMPKWAIELVVAYQAILVMDLTGKVVKKERTEEDELIASVRDILLKL